MSVYLVYDVEISDPEAYDRYKPLAAQSIMSHGGEILVATAEAEAFEGTWSPKWLVVIRFDSKEAAQKWHESEEYRPLKELRQSASAAQCVLAKSRGT